MTINALPSELELSDDAYATLGDIVRRANLLIEGSVDEAMEGMGPSSSSSDQYVNRNTALYSKWCIIEGTPFHVLMANLLFDVYDWTVATK